MVIIGVVAKKNPLNLSGSIREFKNVFLMF